MCGIAGFAGFSEPGLLSRMCDAIVHRGPDGEGCAELKEARIAIGMRRLAIIDLSGKGAQPMVSADGRFAITFNGEIYNYRALRAALEKRRVVFRGDSDTEVLLHLYAEKGAAMYAHGAKAFVELLKDVAAFDLAMLGDGPAK